MPKIINIENWMKFKLTSLIVLFSTAQVFAGQGVGTSNSNAVGFSSHIEIDNSRPSENGLGFGRAIQINTWYPAHMDEGSDKMSFSDYLRLRNSEVNTGEVNQSYAETVENYFQWPLSQGSDKMRLDSIASADISMAALKDYGFAPGKHPVILLIHGSAVDFAFLGESLAGQGYFVVNVPHKGYLRKDLDINSIGMETEIRDYEFALSTLSDHPNVNLINIVALGFSFGGQSALGLACRNPNIKTVVSYDGGIGSRFGARLIGESPFCATENVSASILHIYDASYERTYLDKIRSFVYAERTFVGLNEIAHWHFTSFGYMASIIPNFFGEKEFAKNGYETILGITNQYLSSKRDTPNAIYKVSKAEFDLVNKVEYFEPIKLE